MQRVKEISEDKNIEKVKCWEFFKCKEKECPAYKSGDYRCWLVSKTYCRGEIQGKYLEKMEMCLECEVFNANLDNAVLKETIETVNRQFKEFRQHIEDRDMELRISEEMYQTVFENAGNATLIVDEDTTISWVNTKFEELSGYSKEEIEGKKSWTEFFVKDDLERMKRYHHMRRIDPLSAPTNYETRFIDRQGLVRDMLLTATMIPGTKKSVGNLLDLSERKKLEEQMLHTEKLASVGTMAAGVAHQINNPLAIILGFADMLLDKIPPESESYELLKAIEKQGHNAKRTVETLLSFARISEPKEEEVDINEGIEAVLAVEENTMSINNITVQRDMADSLPKVQGDPSEFQQVFFNIINNAISAMKGGGVLTIVTRLVYDGQNVEIRVSDNGCGIKEEHRAKIFNPFFTTKNLGEGTGLGLTITDALVTKQGGSITFETKTKEESEETGTTFIVSLPAIK